MGSSSSESEAEVAPVKKSCLGKKTKCKVLCLLSAAGIVCYCVLACLFPDVLPGCGEAEKAPESEHEKHSEHHGTHSKGEAHEAHHEKHSKHHKKSTEHDLKEFHKGYKKDAKKRAHKKNEKKATKEKMLQKKHRSEDDAHKHHSEDTHKHHSEVDAHHKKHIGVAATTGAATQTKPSAEKAEPTMHSAGKHTTEDKSVKKPVKHSDSPVKSPKKTES